MVFADDWRVIGAIMSTPKNKNTLIWVLILISVPKLGLMDRKLRAMS